MAAKPIFVDEPWNPQPRNATVANRTVVVKNLSPSTSKEAIIIHFQRRRNGGGEVGDVCLRSEVVAVVTFEKEEVAESVLTKVHTIDGVRVKVDRQTPICGDAIMAAKPISVDEPWNPQPRNTTVANRTVVVKNLSPSTSKEAIDIHFQRRRNGGGEVNDICLRSECVAVVTFEKEEVAESVLTKVHTIDGVQVKVERNVQSSNQDEVTGSGVDEGRGERFVPETEKDVNENVKRETKETSGIFRELTQQPENVQERPRHRDGELREMTRQLTNIRRQLRERDGQLRVKTQQLTNVQGQMQERDGELREMRNQLTDVRRQLQERDGQLTEKDRQLRERDGELHDRDEQLRERDGQLREMRNQLTDVRRQLQERDGQLRNRDGQLRERDGQVSEITKQLTRVRGQLQEKTEEFTSLERQLRTKQHEIDELETSLSAAQRALNERSRHQTPDWVIPRDQIQLTDKCLGKGGWGSVIEGKYCGCAVAVKQMYELILCDHNRRLFEREMSIAARCRHPCLLQFIGATNDEGSPLFVTELMESSLRSLLEQRPLSSLEVSLISLDVARALNYLHLKKPSPIIHRDISSANVLLWRHADQWRGKVSDYGTANVLQPTMSVCPGAMIYSAPEAQTKHQTVKVDVYSFGVLLCEICIRELPDPDRRDEQVAMVTNRVLRALIRGCLQQDAETRPSMEEIIGELEQSM